MALKLVDILLETELADPSVGFCPRVNDRHASQDTNVMETIAVLIKTTINTEPSKRTAQATGTPCRDKGRVNETPDAHHHHAQDHLSNQSVTWIDTPTDALRQDPGAHATTLVTKPYQGFL